MKPSNYVAGLRASMLSDVTLALAILSVPMLMLSISRVSFIGWRASFLFHFVAVACIWIFWWFRNHIRYSWRVGVILVLLGAVGLGGYVDLGPAATSGQFLLLFLVIAALFMRARLAFTCGMSGA